DWASSPSEGESMKREIGEELVDRVVDDECTVEEKRALYEAAERNPEIREAIDAALRIRKLLRSSAGASVPPEFSERLRLAIERSDFWVEREVERPAVRPASTTAAEPAETTKGRRWGGRRVFWATTGAAVAFAAVALLAPGVVDGTRAFLARYDKIEETGGTGGTGDLENGVGEKKDASATKDSPKVAPRLPIRTPQNASTAPETPPTSYSDGFYTRRVLDSANARRLVAEFLQVCRDNNVKYAKIDGDFEFLLTKTTADARDKIWRWLNENACEIAPRAENNLAETWNNDADNVENVRVSFFVSNNEPVGPTE
ncbi:MAG: hypothetical protein IJO46_12235, partial [Thermoguttaceae bacterium]|nr:hypothetical protein [Thermoguttaceae bacterium]